MSTYSDCSSIAAQNRIEQNSCKVLALSAMASVQQLEKLYQIQVGVSNNLGVDTTTTTTTAIVQLVAATSFSTTYCLSVHSLTNCVGCGSASEAFLRRG